MYNITFIALIIYFYYIKLIFSDINNDSPIETHIQVGDKKYNVSCVCPKGINSLDEMLKSDDINQCLTINIKIRKNPHVSEQLLNDVIDSFTNIPKDTFDYVKNNHFSSMDPRTKHPSYFSPGGDMGDFIILLSNISITKPWDEESVSNAFNAYLSTFPPDRQFYHCTDTQAINNIARDLGLEFIDLMNVPREYQDRALDKLIKSKNIGDVFIKKLIDHPSNYGIPLHLIHLSLKSYFKLLWDKKNSLNHKLIFEVYRGEFKPDLFIEVSSIKQCEISGILPKFGHKNHNFHAIIYSESASHYRKRELAKFANRYFNENYSHITDTLDYHTFKIIDEFGKQLAQDMPFIHLTLT